MKSQFPFPIFALLFAVILGGAADGCGSDPNVTGAKLERNNENFDRALVLIDSSLATNPENVEALVLKGEVLRLMAENSRDFQQKDSLLGEMQAAFAHAERLEPENSELAEQKHFAWGTLINSGNEVITNPDSDPQTAVPLFETAIAYQPDSSHAYFGLGLAHLRAGNTGGAITPLEQSWEMNPDPSTAQYLTQAYLNNGQTDKATALLDDATTRYPDNQELQSLKLSAAGDVEAYAAQVEANPDDAMLRYNYGTLLIEEERFDDAIEQLARAHELEPSADAAYNLGVAHFQKAAKIEEESEGLTMDEQEEYDAIMARRDTELEEAVAAFNQARELSDASQEPTICNSLFQVYSALGQTAEAEEAADCAGVEFENGADGNGQ